MGRNIPEATFEDMPFTGGPWQLNAEGSGLELAQVPALFALGNGFIGIRGPGDDEGAPRVYLNGVFEQFAIPYHEAAFGYARASDTRLSVADATRPEILIDGVKLGEPLRVTLDMLRGVRTNHYCQRGIELEIISLVSMVRTAIAAMRIVFPAEHTARVIVNTAVAPPPWGAFVVGQEDVYDPRMAPPLTASPWREHSHTMSEDRRLATRVDCLPVSAFSVAAACAVDVPATGSDGRTTIDVFSAYAAVRDADPLPAAITAITQTQQDGFDILANEQASWFADHWGKCRVGLPDDPIAERAVRHAQFQLVQAVGRDGATSISAKGQTGEGYEGHVFWDADLYVLPVFAFTRPAIARAMLSWRISGLEAARGNAIAMGHKRGALFPWRTIGGSECSSFFPAGSAQYHINADIAFALKTYVEATGDVTILADGGAEMLVETARIWLDIGFHDGGRSNAFVINRVTGPDEYSAIVDNNLYTNLMAAEHLRYAAEIGIEVGLIKHDEANRMRAAADAMLLPFDETRDVYAQDDAFFEKEPWPFADTPASDYPLLLHHHPLKIYRHQVAKQADAVLAVALFPDRFDAALSKRMLSTYEAVTVHDSTLSASAFATAAAHANDRARAYRYWRTSVLTDLCNLFGNSDHGLHMAALAGSWTTLVMGFAGMRVIDNTLTFDPIFVPGLGRYSFRLCFRDTLIEVAVDEAAATYCAISGPPLVARHKREDISVDANKTTRPLSR